MTTRRRFLAASGSVALCAFTPPIDLWLPEPLVSKADLAFLKGLALDTIKAATSSNSRSAMGFDAVTPGGAYPSLWVRDFSMAAGCGLVRSESLLNHLRQIAKAQNGPRLRSLTSGAVVPPWAVPDHVNFEGGAVYFPGTYSSGDDQGGEPFGTVPPVDDHYEFVHLAHIYGRSRRDFRFLDEVIDGVPLLERLARAMDAPRTDPATGLVVTDALRRAVGFGFCDAVYMTGSLAFASILRYRALGEMIGLVSGTRMEREAPRWREQRGMVRSNVARVFQDEDGWLLGATDVGRRPDVWATAFALHTGMLKGDDKSRALDAVVRGYVGGTITWEGAVRHVPTGRDYSATSAWEQTAGVPLNRYQNGAYWHTPSGWLVAALSLADKSLARGFVAEYMAHMRREDFRRGDGKGGPWECVHPDGDYRQNAVYMASVTLPYEVFRSLG